MRVAVLVVVFLEGFGSLEGLLETVLGEVLRKTQRDVPAGQSVCYFNVDWEGNGDLLTCAMRIVDLVAFVSFDLKESQKSKQVDVSTKCSLNVLLLSRETLLDRVFDEFSFNKYSKFIVTYPERLNSLNIAKFLHKWGITNVLFLEKIASTVGLFMYNLLLTEKIPKSALDEDLFPDKLSNLTGYSYSEIGLYALTSDAESRHNQFVRLELLDFIMSRQKAIRNFRAMLEKSPEISRSFFDVIVPFLGALKFKNYLTVEHVHLPMYAEWCLVVPKVRDPRYILVLFRPFRCQLWLLIIIGDCTLRCLTKFLEHKKSLFKHLKTLLRSLCMFILCESYSAKLIAQLNSPIETIYPETLEEFRSSPLQVLLPIPELMENAEIILEGLHGKYALWNQSVRYDWNLVALIDKCNCLKDKTVPEPKSYMGVVLSSNRYHVIDKPLFAIRFVMLFNKRSALTKNVQQCVDRMYEVGVWHGIVKDRKREAGERVHGLGVQYQHVFYGFRPVFVTMVDVWAFAAVLFIIQWINVMVFRKMYYNAIFFVGLNAFLKH